MVGYISQIPNESIVDIIGELKYPEQPIKSCSIKLEMNLLKIYCVDRANKELAF